ncbi:transcriptional regulator, TetR family [Thalassobium sp. R2A62]|nr:transcriptional regulator, TetR family [Thalassobium sp. R2A62]
MNNTQPQTTRGRPKTLNRDHVLQVAMTSYWGDGPMAVSINEVCRRAGVSKPGLYREFGNEDGLKTAALESYRDLVLSQLFEIFEADQPFEDALAALTGLVLQDRVETGLPTGCLFGKMRACRSELGPKTNSAIDMTRDTAQDRMQDWINRAKRNGQLDLQISTATAALYVDAQIASAITMQAESVEKSEISEFLQIAFSGLKCFG